MQSRAGRIAALILALWIGPAGLTVAQEMTTRPAPEPQRGGGLVARIRQNLTDLRLTPEQQEKVDAILLRANEGFRAIGEELLLADPPERRRRMAEFVSGIQREIRAVLTDAQAAEFDQRMRRMRAANRAGTEPRNVPASTTTAAPSPERRMMNQGVSASEQEPADDKPLPAPAKLEIFDDASALKVGAPAPDFSLRKIDGQNVQLSAYKGRIVLVVFGCHTSPSFRQRAAALERIKREYGNRITPLVVYTREAHPVGQWEVERNKDEGISIEQPADMDGRMTHAKRAREALKITVPIAVDTMDDKTAADFDGFTNAAVLIGRDGTVIARQKWFEPYAMRREIDAAIK